MAGNRHRVRGELCRCAGGDPGLCRLCQPPRLCTLCLVSYRAGGCRAGVALGPVAGRLRRRLWAGPEVALSLVLVLGAALGWLGSVLIRLEDTRTVLEAIAARLAGSMLSVLTINTHSIVGKAAPAD